MSLNFRRRYKWLFASSDDNPSELLFEVPPLSRYPEDVRELIAVSHCCSQPSVVYLIHIHSRCSQRDPHAARDNLRKARETISRLLTMNIQTLCGPQEALMRAQVSEFDTNSNRVAYDIRRL